MTAITLTTVWLNSVTDPSDLMSFPNMSELTVSTAIEGSVKVLPAGRGRLFRRDGTQTTTTITLPGCEPDQRQWLEDHVGSLVCARDDRGRKVFGSYFTVGADEMRVGQLSDVAITLVEVSHSEAV